MARKNKLKGFKATPNSVKVRLRYADRTTHSSSSFTIYAASMSNIQTFQPFLRDQYLTIWQNYVVVGVRAVYRVINTDVSGVQGEVLCLAAPASYISSMTLATALEYPTTQKKMLTSIGNAMTITFDRYHDLRKMYDCKIIESTDFWGTAPSGISATIDQQATAICVTNLAGASTLALTIDRELYFDVIFFRPQNPGVSLAGPKPIVFDKPESVIPKKKKPKKILVTESSSSD